MTDDVVLLSAAEPPAVGREAPDVFGLVKPSVFRLHLLCVALALGALGIALEPPLTAAQDQAATYADARDTLAKTMTADQITEALQRIRWWLEGFERRQGTVLLLR